MWPSRPEKLLMLGLLIWGLLLFWAAHYIGDIGQVRPSATIYQLDEIVSFVNLVVSLYFSSRGCILRFMVCIICLSSSHQQYLHSHSGRGGGPCSSYRPTQ